MASKQYRVAILTAKEIEFDAIRRQLIEERREDNTFDGTVYRIAKIRQQQLNGAPNPKWDVAIYRTGRGQQPTTYGTQVLMQHFRPDIVLYVGALQAETQLTPIYQSATSLSAKLFATTNERHKKKMNSHLKINRLNRIEHW